MTEPETRAGVSDAEVRKLADNLPVKCWIADADGAIYWYNRRWYEYTGTTPAEMEGWGWQSVHDPATLDEVLERWRISLASGEPFEMIFPLRGADGTYRPFLTRIKPHRDEAGRITHWFGVNVDITAQHEAEARLADSERRLRLLNESLEARVREEIAAREEAQQRAAHGERMLVLGQLAGGIAHDFNNVLQAVSGGAVLIQRRASEALQVERLAGAIVEASERGASITRRLLSFARRGELREEAVEAAPLLEGLREILSHSLGASVSVRVRYPSDLAPVWADKGQLETALVNLCTNARDAMPEGGTITLTAVAEVVVAGRRETAVGLAPGRYVRISVADTGTGMDGATLGRVAEPFFTTKAAGQGTGLGLAMAKGFADQSGGGLGVETELGEGTTINLWLPEADGARVATPREPSVPSPARWRDRVSVLLVDDEPIVREVTGEQLRMAGFEVAEAAGAEAALDVLRSDAKIDVLVTDLSMPGRSGIGLIEEAHRLIPGLPAILLSGYAGAAAQTALNAALSGAFTVLRKPISGDELADRIAMLLIASDAAAGTPALQRP